MRKILLAALLGIVTVPVVPVLAQDRHESSEHRRDGEDSRSHSDRRDNHRGNRNHRIPHQSRAAWQDYHRYDYNRFDPSYGSYQADRYYRDGRYYQMHRLTNNDRIYRGSNSRYY